MSSEMLKCHVCLEKVFPDSDGGCPSCHSELIEVEKDPEEELQFYCVVCDDFFFACRDGTGYDQAACPECGDLSNTPDFHVGEMEREERTDKKTRGIFFQILGKFFSS